MRFAVTATLLVLSCLTAAQQRTQSDVSLDVVITGAYTVPSEIKQAITKEIQRSVTGISQIPNEMSERIRDEFQRYGYFKVNVYDPTQKEFRERGVVKRIQLTVNVDEGRRYRLGDIRFKNNKVVDVQSLRQAIPMQSGEIFDVEKIRQGFKALQHLYCTQGYINFIPIPNTEIDDEHSLVSMVFDLDEGDQFRVGRIDLDGLEPFPGAGKQILDSWNAHRGEIYTCDWWKTYMADKVDPSLRPITEHGDLLSEISVDHSAHTVNVSLRFP
ncbi:MAG TPA: POTRA domain-containing protein [Terriglobales bacterium]|nr:POTRA domain-containing protein [Terriglobales bacterium]